MGHDQLFKDFLRAFLREFLELFFPDAAARLNFKTAHFLDKELFTDVPEGSVREADLVAQVETLDGEPELLLIHIEVQADRERYFQERMYQYYALLWLRYRLPIFPIAVYLATSPGQPSTETYRVVLLGHEVLRFVYECVGLSALAASEYWAMGSPVAGALAALMDRSSVSEPLTLRALMLKRVAQSDLDDARKFLLVNFIQTYYPLAADEGEAFERLLFQADFREVPEMQVTWADKMKEEGRQAGVLQARREILLRQLTRKFGSLPDEVTSRVNALQSIAELDAYLDRLVTAESVEEMRFGG